MKRKTKETTRTFFQDIQLKKAKGVMKRYEEEKRKKDRSSLERKSKGGSLNL